MSEPYKTTKFDVKVKPHPEMRGISLTVVPHDKNFHAYEVRYNLGDSFAFIDELQMCLVGQGVLPVNSDTKVPDETETKS